MPRRLLEERSTFRRGVDARTCWPPARKPRLRAMSASFEAKRLLPCSSQCVGEMLLASRGREERNGSGPNIGPAGFPQFDQAHDAERYDPNPVDQCHGVSLALLD